MVFLKSYPPAIIGLASRDFFTELAQYIPQITVYIYGLGKVIKTV
jgi:hypothetical protein